MIVTKEFYLGQNVVNIARDLLGKILYTRINSQITAGMIVETEAYRGATDRASHAFPSRKTARNWIMFEDGGRAYVYLIYGIHYLFNIVTNIAGQPDAVLIRALEPIIGIPVMKERRNLQTERRLTSGPGSLSKAMGIDLKIYGEDLTGKKIWLEESGWQLDNDQVVETTRIGVDYAGEDSRLPWRFYLKGNVWISKA